MKNLQSTKIKSVNFIQDTFPLPDKPNVKQHNSFTTLCENRAYFDLTGRFPHQSIKGNDYIIITYDYDSNCILVKAIQNSEATSITVAWEFNHSRLAKPQ